MKVTSLVVVVVVFKIVVALLNGKRGAAEERICEIFFDEQGYLFIV